MVSDGMMGKVAGYVRETFTDAIYELVKAEAIRLHQVHRMELVEAGEIAAYIAMIPIIAIAAGGDETKAVKISDLHEKFFNDIEEL